MSIPFKPADILLPDFSTYNGTPWSCVACDQYTSQPDYWESADATASDSPSTPSPQIRGRTQAYKEPHRFPR